MSTTLQATELRRRRHECRLTRRQLARAASLDLAMIEDAEMHGMAIYQPAAIALTRQLGLDITGSQRERHDTGDSELIGAILADIGEPLAAGTIASALGWTVDRVLDAAGGLRTELRRVGQTVTITASHDLALASHADGISDEIRADLHAARVRIDDTAAALLYRIITGRHEDRLASTLNDKERTIATHMIAAEILTEHYDQLRVSAALAHALDDRHTSALHW